MIVSGTPSQENKCWMISEPFVSLVLLGFQSGVFIESRNCLLIH